MTTPGRYFGTGAEPLVKTIRAAGFDPGDLSQALWEVTWARRYQDVVVPAPALRIKQNGLAVFARRYGAGCGISVVDTTRALWAFVVTAEPPPPGARVRVDSELTEDGLRWRSTTLETLGFGISIRFGKDGTGGNACIDGIRDALIRIAAADAELRHAIAAERRRLTAIEPVTPFKEELRILHAALAQRVAQETAPTLQEQAAYARGGAAERTAIVALCKSRRIERYRAELASFRGRIPELAASHEQRLAANEATHAAVEQLEDAAARHRSRAQHLATARQRLDVVALGGLLVDGDLAALGAVGPAQFGELSATIELLYDLIPRDRLADILGRLPKTAPRRRAVLS